MIVYAYMDGSTNQYVIFIHKGEQYEKRTAIHISQTAVYAVSGF